MQNAPTKAAKRTDDINNASFKILNTYNKENAYNKVARPYKDTNWIIMKNKTLVC